MPRSIVITGGSSGIGKALAQQLAIPGTTLGLVGRDTQRLASVAAECRQRGAQVSVALIDICAREKLAAWLSEFDEASPIDLLIVNAGIMGGLQPHEDIEQSKISLEIFETNVIGAINTIHPIVPRMTARGAGQIAIISSIAGFIPLPDAPSYAASKAAVMSYGLSLRSLLRAKGIKINVVCPGYVATPMTAQEIGWKPFEITPEQAAVLILRGLSRNKSMIAFPRFFSLATRIGGLLPERVRQWTSKSFRFKVNARE